MGKLVVGPGVVRGNPFVFDAVQAVVETLPYDYVVISWLRPGSITTSGNVSNHSKGNALDVRPVGYKFVGPSPCGGNKLDAESQRRNDLLAGALGRMGDRGTDEPVLWETCTGGNHYDHVHVAVLPGANVKAPVGGLISAGARAAGTAGGMVGALEGIAGVLSIALLVMLALGLGLFLIG